MRLRPLLAALLLLGCATGPHPLDASDELPLSEEVFGVGLERIASTYLRPVEVGTLAVAGLNGLKRFDADVVAKLSSGRLHLTVGQRGASSLPAPRTDDPLAWATLISSATAKLRAVSPAIAAVPTDDLYQAIFDGITGQLDDYSRYASTTQAVDERAVREGYGGIGASIESVDGRHVVQSVLVNSAADVAGIRVGDIILAVNGEFVSSLPGRLLRERLRGSVGSVVRLVVQSDQGTIRDLALRRRLVVPSTVAVRTLDDILVLEIERFNASTAYDVREAVATARGQSLRQPRGYILDLRGNPGGLLDQAVAVADLFIPRGEIISTRGRHPDSVQHYEAAEDDIADGRPLVVLMDGRSASSAEIVASALQDSDRAIVIGTTSYGKGSVQTVTRLPNDGELFLTWSRFYAPSGYTIDKLGVVPTVCTSGTPDVEALLARLNELREGRRALLADWSRAGVLDVDVAAAFRSDCPAEEHGSDVDVLVAQRLLGEPALYRRALGVDPLPVAKIP